MHVSRIELHNYRSFHRMEGISLDAINVLIGPNNSGKSSIIRAIANLQDGMEEPFADVRIGSNKAEIHLHLENIEGLRDDIRGMRGRVTISIESTDRRNGGRDMTLTLSSGSSMPMKRIKNVAPNHFIVPYLSRRKASVYSEDVRLQNISQVGSNMSFLAAKLSRISNPAFPRSEQYRSACKAILDVEVTSIPSENGQLPGIYVSETETLPITQLGEGVPSIVALLVELVTSEGKLFLIEEPENDLHPAALKALLDLIVASSSSNQFVISTHSNIVLMHLGAANRSRVYRIDSENGRLPTQSRAALVEPVPQARLDVLRELGYSLSDFDLWSGWLFLEESSAERIIRDYLVRWFAPGLSRVRTLSTKGISEVEPSFSDFDRLVRYAHLESIYKGRAWVRVDGDASGFAVVDRLRDSYKTWDPEAFRTYSRPQFEHYYPRVFSEEVESVLLIQNKQKKREQKRDLLSRVISWIEEDHDRAKAALAESAEEIIMDLKQIESCLSAK